MPRQIHGEDLAGAEIRGVDLTGAEIRDVDLTGARLRGVLLVGAEIDGVIGGLTVNGIEVAPLIEAELDRRHPERRLLRPTTADGAREAALVVTSLWMETVHDAHPYATQSVYNEWTLTETLRHLVFAVDAWFGHALLGEPAPFHPAGLPPSFVTDGPAFGIDPAATVSFDDAVRLHTERLNRVSAFLATATDDDLTATRGPNPSPGFPPPAERTAIECLKVLFSEEWAHHRFAVRDLAVLRQTTQP
jgi:hypothetical protein